MPENEEQRYENKSHWRARFHSSGHSETDEAEPCYGAQANRVEIDNPREEDRKKLPAEKKGATHS
jgi:hypothetical protein